MCLSAVDSWCGGGDGGVCHPLATGHQADGNLHCLYVQGDKSDIRTAVCMLPV